MDVDDFNMSELPETRTDWDRVERHPETATWRLHELVEEVRERMERVTTRNPDEWHFLVDLEGSLNALIEIRSAEEARERAEVVDGVRP